MSNQDSTVPPQNPPNPPAPASSSHTPEHEPLAFHFGNFKEAITQVEQQEAQTPSETFPSPLNNQPYTPPILQSTAPTTRTANPTPVAITDPTHPPLPLSDEEIEANANSKKMDHSIHWLALWCVRQLEIYEKSLNQTAPKQ